MCKRVGFPPETLGHEGLDWKRCSSGLFYEPGYLKGFEQESYMLNSEQESYMLSFEQEGYMLRFLFYGARPCTLAGRCFRAGISILCVCELDLG